MFLEEINFYRNGMVEQEESVLGFIADNFQDGFTDSIQFGDESAVKGLNEEVNESLAAQYMNDLSSISPVGAIMNDMLSEKPARNPELDRRTEDVINRADEIERKYKDSQKDNYGFNR